MEFKTEVNGIPCICKVLSYYAGSNRAIDSASLEPNDEPEFEYEILNIDGEHDRDLELDMTCEEDEQIYKQYLGLLEEERAGI